jgi:CTP:molybdopterin cytidylyltransferase MocA
MDRSRTFTALVMAGSRGVHDPVAAACGLSHKALAPIEGRPMIEHVLDAVAATPAVGRIIAVIERPEILAELPVARRLLDAGRLRITTARPSPSQSVLAVLDGEDAYPVLVTTGDHPLLTPVMIEEFVAAVPRAADVAALVARDRIIRGGYPETRRTYLRFADAAVSGCNLFVLATPGARRAIELWRRIERDRKRPWRMARSLGSSVLVRYLLRRLTLRGAAAALGTRAGVRAVVVESRFAEAAIDVDKVEDLVLARRILAERRRSAAGRPA